MKTLTEVIKAYEICHASVLSCEGCPYDNGERYRDSDCYIADALHYLKEYRSDKAMWKADRKGHLDWIEQYKEAREKHQMAVIELKHKEKEVNDILTDYVALKQYWAEQQANPPLSWDELRQMEGKPVWVETKTKGGRWMILSYFGDVYKPDDTVMFASGYNGGTSTCYKKNMGITWNAYRKER